MDLPINGANLHCVIAGPQEGTPCLVLHGGLGLDHNLYLATLPSMFPELRLIFFDQRDNGRSRGTGAVDFTMEQLADDAAGLAAQHGINRMMVFGHSYGGFVAQELALRHPNLVQALILVGTTPGQLGSNEGPTSRAIAERPSPLVKIWTDTPTSDEEAEIKWRESLPYFTNAENIAELSALFDNTVFKNDALIRSAVIHETWSPVDQLSSITSPTLLVVGELDRICDPPQTERFAANLPNHTSVVLRGSNHFPWIETPAAFKSAVSEWMGRLS